MKPLIHTLTSFVFLFCFSALVLNAQDFKSSYEALNALNTMGECKCDTDIRAYKYFVGHKEESIPILINFTENNRQRHFVGIRALSKLKDERVSYFLIGLLSRELHNVGCPDGQICYSSELISDLIRTLGDYGDQRAIPLIRESMNRLNDNDRDAEEEALSKLGDISIDKSFELKSKSKSEILKLASSNEYGNPDFSLKVFDWIIKTFPNEADVLYQSHVGRVNAFINLEDYESVLKECEIIKTSYPDPIKDLWFSIGRMGRRLDELVKFTKGQVGKAQE